VVHNIGREGAFRSFCGVFVRHVRTVGDGLVDGGVIDGGERAELIRAAGRSDVGRR
jgi:hypothetical protein